MSIEEIQIYVQHLRPLLFWSSGFVIGYALFLTKKKGPRRD